MALVKASPQLLVETEAGGGLGYEWNGEQIRVSDRKNLPAELAATPSYQEAFLFGGQSNADGRGSMAAATLTKPALRGWMLDKGNTFRAVVEPSGEQVAGWINNIPGGGPGSTPEHSSATDIAKNCMALAGIVPCIVPCAIGSTRISQWLNPEPGISADAQSYSTLFGALVKRGSLAKVSGRQPVITWFGHESDADRVALTLATGALTVEYNGWWYGLIKDIRAYFPSAPVIFAQVSTSNDAATATGLMRVAEAQRRSVDAGSPAIEATITLGAPVPVNTNGTNSITVQADGSVQMVGDGSTSLGWTQTGLSAGVQYLLSLTVTGTGVFKFLANTDMYVTRGAGRHEFLFTAVGTATLAFYRSTGGEATNLNIKINSCRSVSTLQVPDSHMIVTHDLKRNAGADSIHLSAEAQQEVGRRYALMYAEKVLGLAGVDGSGPRIVSVTSTDSTHTKVKFTQQIAPEKTGETNYGDGTNSLFRVYDAGTERAVSTVAIDGSDNTSLIITHAAASGVRLVTYGDRAGQDAEARKGCVYNTTAPRQLPAPQFCVVAT